jgi:hypothetical protein
MIVCFDMSNPRCYTSGTTVYNLAVPGSYNATVENSPTVSNGQMTMNGINQSMYFQVPASQARTVCIVYKLANTSTGWGPLWRSEDWRERVFTSNVTLVDSGGTYYDSALSTSDNVWQHIVYSYEGTRFRTYKNGVLQQEVTNVNAPWSTGTYTYYSGKQAGGSTVAYVAQTLNHLSFYNISLSDAEVEQHFNALRGRVGI